MYYAHHRRFSCIINHPRSTRFFLNRGCAKNTHLMRLCATWDVTISWPFSSHWLSHGGYSPWLYYLVITACSLVGEWNKVFLIVDPSLLAFWRRVISVEVCRNTFCYANQSSFFYLLCFTRKELLWGLNAATSCPQTEPYIQVAAFVSFFFCFFWIFRFF